MNALIYSINEILNQIPRELLQAGIMIDEQPQTAHLTTVEDKILRKVIKKRVMVDANIVGGVEMIIPLMGIDPHFTEQYYTVYQIPPELTMNREIVSALNLTFMPSNGYFGTVSNSYGTPGMGNQLGYAGINYSNPVMNVADRIGNAASSSGVLGNTHIEIVAYNTILVYAHYRTLANFGLRVVVANEDNMNNIQPRSYKAFSTLCVLAVKAFLYNRLIIAINSGYLSGGQELGMFKMILESYNTAEEDYNTYFREVWGKVAFMNDNTRMNRYLASMLNPSL